jgi:hypothetical protein
VQQVKCTKLLLTSECSNFSGVTSFLCMVHICKLGKGDITNQPIRTDE